MRRVKASRASACAAPLRRERRWVRSLFSKNSTALWSHHTILLSDETWLSEWSDGMGERSDGAVRSRGVLGRASLGKI